MDERDVRKIVVSVLSEVDREWMDEIEFGTAVKRVSQSLEQQAEPVKLNPCVTCGNKMDGSLTWAKQCNGCGSKTGNFNTQQESVMAWNAANPLTSKPEERRYKPPQRFRNWLNRDHLFAYCESTGKYALVILSTGEVRQLDHIQSFRFDGFTLKEIGIQNWTPVEDGK